MKCYCCGKETDLVVFIGVVPYVLCAECQRLVEMAQRQVFNKIKP